MANTCSSLILVIFAVFVLCGVVLSISNISGSNVYFLDPGGSEISQQNNSDLLKIYCYTGKIKHIQHIWETVWLQMSLPNEEFKQFDGSSPKEVMAKFDEHRTSWNIFTFHHWNNNNIRLNPFQQSCIGILTKNNYSIKLHLIRIDYWKILIFLSGLSLFLFASKLSHNSLFYYLTGISFGMGASFLILVFLISRLLPRKPFVYSILVGGWAVSMYIAQLFWNNITTVVLEHKSAVIFYFMITGIVSFIICYRFGPVTHPRTKNLVKWALQGTSLGIIFCSSEFQEASVVFIIFLIVSYNIPRRMFWKGYIYIKRHCYHSKPRLLTDSEFYNQGIIETEKALRELQGYCSSPECNQWKTVLKLKDPLRFAKFMEGSSHVIDQEVSAFEEEQQTSLENGLLTDDEDDSSDLLDHKI